MTFVLRQEEGSEAISKAALLQFLQHEYEVCVLLLALVKLGPVCALASTYPLLQLRTCSPSALCLCAQNADSSDAAVSQPQMPPFMPFQQAGQLVLRSPQDRGQFGCRLNASDAL